MGKASEIVEGPTRRVEALDLTSRATSVFGVTEFKREAENVMGERLRRLSHSRQLPHLAETGEFGDR